MGLWMRENSHCHVVVIVAALIFCRAVSVRADSVFTPFIGTSYGEEGTDRVTTLGASLAAMAGGVLVLRLILLERRKLPGILFL